MTTETRKDHFDVLIAGGGPAGLSTAISAARGGLKVAVFERSKEIGYPIHTSGGSWILELRKLGIPDRFMHPIHRGFFIASSTSALYEYDEPVSCILDVRGLYQHLAERAAREGVSIFPASHVISALCQDSRPCGLRIKSKGEFYAPLLIDATGTSGLLARQFGLRDHFKRFGVGAEIDLVSTSWPQDTIALLFGKSAVPAGYGWIFPHGHDRVRVGLGLIRPDAKNDPETELENWISGRLQRYLPVHLHLDNKAAIEYHKGVIPALPAIPKSAAHGLLVVGDAGALISTLLGEGIRFAIDIGQMAGEMAIKANKASRYDARFLSQYDRRWRKKYQRQFSLAAHMNRRLSRYGDSDWNEKIEMLSRLPAAVIPALLRGEWYDRELMKCLWKYRHESGGLGRWASAAKIVQLYLKNK